MNKYGTVYLAIKQDDDCNVIDIAVVDQSGRLLLNTSTETHDLQNILHSADEVVVQEEVFTRNVIDVGVDVNMVCLESIADKIDKASDCWDWWADMNRLCLYKADIDTDHLPENAVGDAERLRIVHPHLIKKTSQKGL